MKRKWCIVAAFIVLCGAGRMFFRAPERHHA